MSETPIRVICPACRTTYSIGSDLLGQQLRCARCEAVWTAIGRETVDRARAELSDVEAECMDISGGFGALDSDDAPGGSDYWIGKQLGRYVIRSILGTGAVGHVYRGHDAQLGRDVALKILPKPKGEKPTLRVKLFLQEARAAARLQHPNIVTIYEVGQDGQFYYFAMEVVDGGTLKELVLAIGRLAAPRACFLVGQAAQALAYAHQAGVIHRDIKPDNLMMDPRGVLKVADFGLAEIGEVDVMKLYGNRPIGTPGYLAPETARGAGATAASDIYCLGLCLVYLLTGQKYLRRATVAETVALCADPPPFDAARTLPGVPEGCQRIATRCLQADPAARYPTAQALADDLRRFVSRSTRDDSASPLPIAPVASPPADAGSRWSALRRIITRSPS